ncbi:MAG: single-stranded-DNA-specific exonuclease RecJ [Anaerolineae bacterium]|nr:single-stranded-DNA-specific exonuclease RecJ [Anaerolineae bacterium]
MSTLAKRWLLRPQADRRLLRQYGKFHPVLAQVLYNRGYSKPVDAEAFLYARKTQNPLEQGTEMKDVRRTARRLLEAIQRKELIIVYGDFDADGVTSTVLMVTALKYLGANVRPYIPHRVDEGYGLNSDALERLSQDGAKVIITVDCGIRSVQDVEDGKAMGLDIIITDHHSIGPEIPNAFAVVNPKQEDCPYPEDMLAGVGVAHKVASTLMQLYYGKRMYANKALYQKVGQVLEDLLDLVAIGTVADLAPLDRVENRVLVRRGLEVLNDARRPGVKALLEVAGIEPGKVSAMSIGFGLGPRINAAGRLESAMLAYDLLSTSDYDQALELAHQLDELNSERQDLTRAAQDVIRQQLVTVESDTLPLIFAGGDFQPGIVGLVAGRLVEEFYRPSVVMERGESESRASCRSIPQFDITSALDECAELLVRHGGHAQAAGFTVLNENLGSLQERLTQLAVERLEGQELRPVLEIDAVVDVNQLSEELVDELSYLEPTGHMNPAPVLVSQNLYVLDWRLVGRDGRHLKFKVARAGRPPVDAIAFGMGDWTHRFPCRIDVAYQLEINEWNGRRTMQMNVQDIREAGTP